MKQNNELYHHGVLGMKWGKRRYQNKDGSLTTAGQKRYERDQRENAGKKRNRVGQADPNRWVREDMERSKRLSEASSNMINELKNANDKSLRKSNNNKRKMDLSSMSDKEMRDKINRAYLEKQYDEMFNPKKVSKGREIVTSTLESAGTVLALTSTSLGIALAIKELRG